MERPGLKAIVIDANIALSQAIELPYSEQATHFLEASRRERDRLIVPSLWWYEVVSGLRRAVVFGILGRQRAFEALDQISRFRLETLPPSPGRNHSALVWAEKISQSNVHDAQYLALADEFTAEFWTADKRLVNAVRQTGSKWIHLISEIPTSA